MSTSSQKLLPVQEIPCRPEGTMEALKTFALTLSEFKLIWQCRRYLLNDVIVGGLDPWLVGMDRKPVCESLEERALIFYNVETRKYELTVTGRLVVLTVPFIAQGIEPRKLPPATVLNWPGHSA